jgi:hypothetical protein
MKSDIDDITFSERYQMNNCSINFEIDFEDIDSPLIDIFIEGILTADI